MPLKNGRMTGKERTFVTHLARTDDPVYAATKAGYRSPDTNGYTLARKFEGQKRETVLRWLQDEGPAFAIGGMVRIAEDPTMPPGVRFNCLKDIRVASGTAIEPGDLEKELHEMTGDELRQHTAKLEAQAAAMRQAMADRARPVLENEGDSGQNAQVAPNPFD